jgi:RsiW-degrading membrane proteinase PrsW (M82 family)
MSYKSIIFFAFIFSIIIFGYFYYDTFTKYFPIHILIKLFLLLIGICGIFFPQIIKKLREGEDMENIKEFIIEKYKKK